jgi:hypothetical protein
MLIARRHKRGTPTNPIIGNRRRGDVTLQRITAPLVVVALKIHRGMGRIKGRFDPDAVSFRVTNGIPDAAHR